MTDDEETFTVKLFSIKHSKQCLHSFYGVPFSAFAPSPPQPPLSPPLPPNYSFQQRLHVVYGVVFFFHSLPCRRDHRCLRCFRLCPRERIPRLRRFAARHLRVLEVRGLCLWYILGDRNRIVGIWGSLYGADADRLVVFGDRL